MFLTLYISDSLGCFTYMSTYHFSGPGTNSWEDVLNNKLYFSHSYDHRNIVNLFIKLNL